jgi:hypothetical protein
MNQPSVQHLETDSRFPSGPWTGYFQQRFAGKGRMELRLEFANGVMKGQGRDRVGEFTIRGRYDVNDGKCYWNKHYVGAHDVHYQGYNEGKGIWGVWEINHAPYPPDRGGFHIWPQGMAMDDQLTEEVEADVVIEGTIETSEPLSSPLR